MNIEQITYRSSFIERLLLGSLLLFSFLLLNSCSEIQNRTHKGADPIVRDLPQIRESGKLILLTENTSTSYFLYRGQPVGYDYDLVKAFAKSQGLELEVKVIHDLNKMFDLLRSGEGDIIACNLVVNAERQQIVDFTVPIGETRQVLVQRKPEGWRKMRRKQWEDSLIRTIPDLQGKTILAHKYSSFWSRLYDIQHEQGIQIDIREAPGDIDSEELIHLVAEGEIPFTVADENVALLNHTYNASIDVETAISVPQQIAWAVRPNADSLLVALDEWLSSPGNNRLLAYTHTKYFESVKDQKARVQSEFSSLGGNRISMYDEAIKTHSEELDWDWRLLASLVYTESRFDPDARSWAGAFGLMQLMPVTAERFGIDSTMKEEANIQAGVGYLKYLNKFWMPRVEDNSERIQFVLASYNVGHGHVLDAQNLAIELGLDPQKWDDNVELALEYKSQARYYQMDCVKYGYCRGNAASLYVKNVLNQYKHYVSLAT
ncbi:MAG: transporter substrate-binding domain-containing protein [Flavobacteriales bacterium]|nr:transporter substrate-binding domain-containing protein [Flavobacteriales bacterium]